MGVVYEAVDTRYGGTTALKVLHKVSAEGIYHLKQEFRALIDVTHLNLVRLHELFSDGDRWFFTMDLVDGKQLIEGLGTNPDIHAVRGAFSQLAAGIHAIHHGDKLHRDLKPSNVILSKEGKVTILDFGLATEQKCEETDSATKNDSASGTPLYMAPEQIVFENATEASDWYAFGAMLFQALTGATPFTGSPRTLLLNKCYRDAPRVSSLCKDVPANLDELCAKLLAREPEARAGYVDVVGVFGAPKTTSLPPPRRGSVPFVGRNEELAQLSKAFQTMEQEQPVIAVVHGKSGIGKSALVEQFLYRVRLAGQTVALSGRCYDRESVPFKGCDSLIDDLSRYLNHLPYEQTARLLPRNILSLSHMFPVLHRLAMVKQTKERHPLTPSPNERRIAALTALKNLLAHIAEQEPLILFVDDLQWCDEDGAKLLSSLISPPNPPPILLVVAYRSEESDHGPGLGLFLERIKKLDGVSVHDISLGSLDVIAAKSLAEQMLPEEKQGQATRVVTESGGSPYFISELVRHGSGAQHNTRLTLVETIKSRIQTLSTTDRMILEAICVSNGPIGQRPLRCVIDIKDIESGLCRLRDQNLIVYLKGPGGPVRIYHDRVKEAVISELDEETVQTWHTKFAAALETIEPSYAVLLAEHLRKAGMTDKAGTCAATAANHARDALAFDQAAKLYNIALEFNPGSRKDERNLQIQLANVLGNAGRGRESAHAYLQAAEGSPVQQELELRQLATNQLMITGHIDKGKQELTRVLKRAGIRPHKTKVGTLASLMFSRAMLTIRGLRFQERTIHQVAKKDRLLLQAYKAAIQGYSLSDRLRSLSYSRRYLRLALRLGLVDDIVFGLAQEAIHLSVTGPHKRPAVNACLKCANNLVSKSKNPLVEGYFVFALGSSAWYLGDLVKSAEYLEQAEKIYLEKCSSASWEYTVLKSMYGTALSGLGNWKKMQRQWDTWTADAEDRSDLYLLTVQRLWPSGTYRWLAADRPDKVWALLSSGLRECPIAGDNLFEVFAAMSASYTNIYCGNYLDAFHPLEKKLSAFLKTPAGSFSPFFKSIVYSRLAYGAVAHALVARNKNQMLDIAEQQVNTLNKANAALTSPFVPAIQAAIAHQKGDEETATKRLYEAIRTFKNKGYELYATATRRQLGRLLGGSEGRALIAWADQTMGEEDIVNPERIAAMLVPGFFL